MPFKPVLVQGEPSPAERIRTRIKSVPRAQGLLQCPKCGSRTVISEIATGVIRTERGRSKGTVHSRDTCAICKERGITTVMLAGDEGPKR